MGVPTKGQGEAIDTERLEDVRAEAENAMMGDAKLAEALAAGGMGAGEIAQFAKFASNPMTEPLDYDHPDYKAHSIDIVINGKKHIVDMTNGLDKEELATLKAFAEAKTQGGKISWNGFDGEHRTIEITTPNVPKVASSEEVQR